MKEPKFYKGLAVLMATVVAGLIAEGALRLLALVPSISAASSNYTSSPYLAYGPKPFSHVTGKSPTGEFAYDNTCNSLGLRDEEHALQKPAGVFRILGLGDSFTYGTGAHFEESYLYLLEQSLNARPGPHPRVEIIKAGVPRFFPEPERMLLESLGRKFEPDLIIVGFLPNDVVDTYLGLDAVTVDKSGFLLTRQAAELGAFGLVLYKYSYLCRLVLAKYVSWRISREYRPDLVSPYQENGPYEATWGKIEEEYGKMAALAKVLGAELLVLHIPQQGPWTERHNYPPHRLGQWAQAKGVAFLDCLPAMKQAAPSKRLYYPQDGHCTPAGYAIIADELAKYLTEKRLVP